jgi:peptide/nickel transport system permease protein
LKLLHYIERRLLHCVLLLAAVSVFSFGMSLLAPGSYFDEMKLNPQISAETIAGLRAQYGIDQPLVVRYGHWMKAVLKGDFGHSFAYNLPVSTLLKYRIRNTLLLGTAGMLLAWAFALPLGILSACHRQKLLDRVAAGFSTLLLGTPELVLGLLFLLLAARTQTLPAGGMMSLDSADSGTAARATDIARHLIIPSFVLALAALPVLFRHIRSSMVEALNAPFIQAARGHGITQWRLLLRHALPAAANPLITLFGISVATLLSGSLLVEVISGWPGIGPLFLTAIYDRDFFLVIGVVLLSSLFLVSGNFIADMLLYASDPRIRAEAK